MKDEILTNSNSWGCTTQVFLHFQSFRQSFSHQTPSLGIQNENLQQLVKLHLHSNMAKNEFFPHLYTNSKKPQFLGIRSLIVLYLWKKLQFTTSTAGFCGMFPPFPAVFRWFFSMEKWRKPMGLWFLCSFSMFFGWFEDDFYFF